MYIKIERQEKTQMHHVKSYYLNELKTGIDLNIECIDGERRSFHIDNGDKVRVFVMNEDGKTIDRI